jgi:signal transduction histidine kinase
MLGAAIARQQTQDALLEAKEAAESANRAKSQFLANMSHELRTPLNHIIGFTEVLVDKHFGDLNQKQEQYLEDVLKSSRHLLSLVNDILDLSKVEAGKLELNPGPVHLVPILQNSLIMVKEKAMKQRIELALNIEEIPEPITADERLVKQILYNLLSNAVKFTPDKGRVLLEACRANDGEAVAISVSDSGIGLKPEDLERIFDPFEQADGSFSRKYQGTGLGLALTRKMVEMHGGKIWAESEGLNQGSRFQFTLPI